MGVKGLQHFMEHSCPEACVTVNLAEMAGQHRAKQRHGCTTASNTTDPTLVVDGMACLRHWYSCKDWVCGGQWNEYMGLLERWVEAFTSVGIRLVFFFDGVIEEQKRREWVKRRLRVCKEISKLFCQIKAHGGQPSREYFCLPSGLASFTPFGLRSLGQEVYCSVREADYEIASYARLHGCMGILGQDSDFIIFDSAPYLSVSKLCLDRMTTILYNRETVCRSLGLTVSQLPLLACLLGNDVVSEERMQRFRSNAVAAYRRNHGTDSASMGEKVFALAHLLCFVWGNELGKAVLIPESLDLPAPDRELLERGVRSYLLPGQEAPQGIDIQGFSPGSPCVMEGYVSPEILKVCRQKHIMAEDFLVYNVVFGGVVECSNTLEDEEDAELMPQALVYKGCRQRVYGLLLHKNNNSSTEMPAVKEWFVFAGNPLKEPEIIYPAPPSLPGNQPSLEALWFGSGPEVSDLRLASFLSVFDCQEFSELHETIEDYLLATLCLVTYIVLQVQHLSLEDVDAYLSQAVCLRHKSPQELQRIKLPYLSSRAVQLGSLYVRGLGHLLGANCASGCPLSIDALMPWRSFDGRLFHTKYLLAHSGAAHPELLSGDSSCTDLFLRLRGKVLEACEKRGRSLQSRPRTSAPEGWHETTSEHRPRNLAHVSSMHTGFTSADRHGCGESDEWRGGGWRDGGIVRRDQSGRSRGHGGRGDGPRFHPRYSDESLRTSSRPLAQRRGQTGRPSRQRYQLAPRWSQPPGPGT